MAIKKKKAKSVKPKATKKGSSKKKLTVVSGEQCFWLHNGPALASLKDLNNTFSKMTNDQFTYHANKTKNDFASWVEFVLMDPECAHNLKKCANKASARSCTLKALKKYR
ncbi:MAG: hypothetical protein HZB09_02305 [Candidatus Yonathbacteria bacterium]|nr:hypothetical protein [Candidatus Yonathbacteria bacterium]